MNPEIRRSLILAIVIGLIAGGLVIGLHRSDILAAPEKALAGMLSVDGATRVLGNAWQYLIVFVLAIGSAFMTLITTRRGRLGLFVAILLFELGAAAWVLSLYHVLFQPLPAILATAFGFLFPIGYLKLAEMAQERRDRPPVETPVQPETAPVR